MIVLQIVVSQPLSAAGSCPAGSATLPPAAEEFPGSGQCYRRQPAANQQPANYGLGITVPAADRTALTAITTKAYRSRDSIATIVAGKTWSVANVPGPFTGQFEIPAQSASQALQLQRTLIPSA